MKMVLLACLAITPGLALAAEHHIIPGSKITFGRAFEFKNNWASTQTFEIEGKRVDEGSFDDSYETWCNVLVDVSAASTGRIAAGRAYVVMPTPADGSHPHSRRSQLFLSSKVSISCLQHHRWTDHAGDRDSTYGSASATEELLKKTLPFLKVERKQNPDEDL